MPRACHAPPRVLAVNFGPWGEVGMAREGTKAHQLSLASGEIPMASVAAISCIAQALHQHGVIFRGGCCVHRGGPETCRHTGHVEHILDCNGNTIE